MSYLSALILIFSISQEIAWEYCPQNHIFIVEWHVRPQLNLLEFSDLISSIRNVTSINYYMTKNKMHL